MHVRPRVPPFPDVEQEHVAPGVQAAAGQAPEEAGEPLKPDDEPDEAGGVHDKEGGAVGQGPVGQAQ